ncbi:MAG TPA: pitrilysin family protein [Pyrinomonadaceae bacterium]|nr:pitrilysin family protein [Pyrinomonadaceae bacterium]
MTNRITRNSYFYYSICLLLVTLISTRAGAQTAPEPVREQLLNGLTVLFWQRPGDPNVLIKLRVESGAAFDLAGKGGTMALLGDVLFPDPVTREYVSEQLGGRLDVSTNHDAIDVTISGRAGELERIVDFLRGALVTPQITLENVAKVRETKLKQLSERANSPSETADREIALRLFGAYPYGHPPTGTVESVSKIDRPDLMFARERFLNANDATMVVIGGVDKLRLMRALRQLLGPWQKGTHTVPATFRQPSPAGARVLIIDHPGATTAELRLAVRGLARPDRDAEAASLLALIVRDRLRASSSDLATAFARHEAHDLPGMFVLGASVPSALASKALSDAQDVIRSMAKTGPTALEFERAREEMLAEISRQASREDLREATADNWLSMEIYQLMPPANQIRNLSLADVQNVTGRLFKDVAPATIVVGNADQLKSSFGGNIEVRGAKPK